MHFKVRIDDKVATKEGIVFCAGYHKARSKGYLLGLYLSENEEAHLGLVALNDLHGKRKI
jgi:hypothetical protein